MCEVNYSIQKKKLENSKYILNNKEDGTQIFIFELIFNNEHNLNSTIRRIKKNNQGNLVSLDDSIMYDKVMAVKIAVLNINNINNEINIDIEIDHSSTYTTFISNDIYLEFNKNAFGCLECNYNIRHN